MKDAVGAWHPWRRGGRNFRYSGSREEFVIESPAHVHQGKVMRNFTSARHQRGESVFGALIGMAIFLTCFGAWLTHLYVCFSAAKWGFLIAGAIFFPVAIVHGIGIWFHAW